MKYIERLEDEIGTDELTRLYVAIFIKDKENSLKFIGEYMLVTGNGLHLALREWALAYSRMLIEKIANCELSQTLVEMIRNQIVDRVDLCKMELILSDCRNYIDFDELLDTE